MPKLCKKFRQAQILFTTIMLEESQPLPQEQGLPAGDNRSSDQKKKRQAMLKTPLILIRGRQTGAVVTA